MIAIGKKEGKAMVTAVNRHQTKRAEILEVYLKAKEIIKDTPKWANGREINVYKGPLRGKKALVYLKNERGIISLILFRAGKDDKDLMGRFYSEKFHIASFIPVTGWKIVSTEADYRFWNRQTRRALGLHRTHLNG